LRFLKLISVFLIVFTFSKNSNAIDISNGCNVSFADAVKIIKNTIFTSYNIFPMRIGGIPIGSWEELVDYKTLSWFPVCACLRGGIPLPGIKISMHRPKALIDVVKDPYCSPSLGMKLPIPFGTGKKAYGTNDVGDLTGDSYYTYEYHYFRFPYLSTLGISS